MRLLGSLTNRIFLASAALAVVSIGFAVFFVSRTTTRQAEAELQRGLLEAGTLVDQQCATLERTLAVMARLVADSPRLKAAVDTGDPPTVQPLALDYQQQLGSALLLVTNRRGEVMASAGDIDIAPAAIPDLPEIQSAMAGRETSGFWPQSHALVQVVTVPIAIGLDTPELMGSLTVGVRLDDERAAQFKRATESDIAFAVGGEIRASTLPPDDRAQLATLLRADTVQTIGLTAGEYVALRRPLAPSAGSSPAPNAPTVLLLRSRTERLRFLTAIHTGLAVMAIVAVIAATGLSYGVARTITRPLEAITNTMRDMAATGDLTRKIPMRRDGRWGDEDAHLLATTFNTLTDSIARFQREASQRERLSALGRLSTVVAHEIRNPLMIIKASLRTLGGARLLPDERQQALADVDGEVARLNRIVNDVLDFARPIRFDYAAADVNALCADAEHATRDAAAAIAVKVNADPLLAPVVTDAERLRIVLINLLTNARDAVAARRPHPGDGNEGASQIELDTVDLRRGNPVTDRAVRIVVRDRGVGIDPEDVSRVFDPYFTTKRTGSGLGLAIARNIVEGMGGTIVLDSRLGLGTEIRIELPSRRDDDLPGAA